MRPDAAAKASFGSARGPSLMRVRLGAANAASVCKYFERLGPVCSGPAKQAVRSGQAANRYHRHFASSGPLLIVDCAFHSNHTIFHCSIHSIQNSFSIATRV